MQVHKYFFPILYHLMSFRKDNNIFVKADNVCSSVVFEYHLSKIWERYLSESNCILLTLTLLLWSKFASLYFLHCYQKELMLKSSSESNIIDAKTLRLTGV